MWNCKKYLKISENHSMLKDLDLKAQNSLSNNMHLLWALWGLPATFSWDHKTTEQETTLRFLCQKCHTKWYTNIFSYLLKHTKTLLHLSPCMMRCVTFSSSASIASTAGPDLHVTLEPISHTKVGSFLRYAPIFSDFLGYILDKFMGETLVAEYGKVWWWKYLSSSPHICERLQKRTNWISSLILFGSVFTAGLAKRHPFRTSFVPP